MVTRSSDGSLGVIPYLMCGHPSREATLETLKRLSELPVAAIELGVPFSDPLADGPVIQKAGQAALAGGMTLKGALEIAAEARDGVPLVLMNSVNPVLAYGPDRFVADATAARVAGVIIPDLPVDEAGTLADELRQGGLWTVFLAAPTSTPERIARICAASRGFVYCVTLTGITGMRAELPEGLPEFLDGVRAQAGQLPVAAGFGISRPEHIRALRGHADAAVVGSAIVREMDEGRDPRPLVESLLEAAS